MITRHFYSAIHLYARFKLPRVISSGLHAWSTCRLATATAINKNIAVKYDSSHHFDAPKQHLTNRQEPIDENCESFANFPLDELLVSRLHHLGFNRPFEIQSISLPSTLEGRDVLGKALTGSGKTLAFALPIIQKLSHSKKTGQPRAIVIAPTRELCSQVHGCIADLSSTLTSVALYGGTAYGPQTSKLRRGADVICATPGRLNDHLQRKNFVLDDVEILILDEADEMLTPNFREQIENILDDSPKNKQILMFGATMPKYIKEVAKKYLKNPVVIDITKKSSPFPKTVTHKVVKLFNWSCRSLAVRNIIAEESVGRSVVFVSTKAEANDLAQKLDGIGLSVKPLHSDLSQSKREEIIEGFRSGYLKAIVATDVAARGLDIPETDLVIQVGPPPNGFDFYVHRTGRTGRAGRSGVAVLIYGSDRKDKAFLSQLSNFVNVEEKPSLRYEDIAKFAINSASDKLNQVDDRLMKYAVPKANELLKKDDDSDESVSRTVLARALLVLADLPKFVPRQESRGFDDKRRDRFSRKSSNRRDDAWLERGNSGRGDGRRNFERGDGRRNFEQGDGRRNFDRDRDRINFDREPDRRYVDRNRDRKNGNRDRRRREFSNDFNDRGRKRDNEYSEYAMNDRRGSSNRKDRRRKNRIDETHYFENE